MDMSKRSLYYFGSDECDSDYISSEFSGSPLVVEVSKYCVDHLVFREMNLPSFEGSSVFDHPHWWEKYVLPVAISLERIGVSDSVRVAIGDNRDSFDLPTITKSRARGAANCYLMKLNEKRHWSPALDISKHDCAFDDKNEGLAWRGVSTGVWRDCDDSNVNSSRYNLMQNWSLSDSGLLNIGLSAFAPSMHHSLNTRTRDMISSFTKESLSYSQQLRHRFILCLEGNDVATNLKWVMASNSVPLMPHPAVESWCMEFKLQPWVNYVPIEHDTSDLLTMIEEANQDIDLLRWITSNNNQFMNEFNCIDEELSIADKVVDNCVLRTSRATGSSSVS